jgi:hypothetical protein
MLKGFGKAATAMAGGLAGTALTKQLNDRILLGMSADRKIRAGLLVVGGVIIGGTVQEHTDSHFASGFLGGVGVTVGQLLGKEFGVDFLEAANYATIDGGRLQNSAVLRALEAEVRALLSSEGVDVSRLNQAQIAQIMSRINRSGGINAMRQKVAALSSGK